MKNDIKDFFEKYILPLNKQSDVHTLLDMEFDRSRDSYFTEPMFPKYLYLENISFENERELKDYLLEFWKDKPSLLKLVPDLAKLAFVLKEEHKEQSAELSPFVYAMF